MTIFAAQINAPVRTVNTLAQQTITIPNILFYLPALLWILLLFSIALGLWNREKGVLTISLWSLLLLISANPHWLNLPGQGAINITSVLIAAYIPASLLVGYLAGLLENLLIRNRKTLAVLLSLIAISLGLWGTFQRLGDLQTSNILLTRPDLQAMEWIQKNTPSEARFLVNSYFVVNSNIIMGLDGGWWLPYLTERQTTLPPLAYDFDQGPQPNYIGWVATLTSEIQNKGITNPDVLALLQTRDISFVYFGQGHWPARPSGPYIFGPEQILTDPNFHLVYHQDQVWIFKIQPVP